MQGPSSAGDASTSPATGGNRRRNRSSRIAPDRLHFAATFSGTRLRAFSPSWRKPVAANLLSAEVSSAGPCSALVLCTSQSGCVQRRMTVRTNPPGALLYVDDYPIGTTPCSTSFTYYGTRKIRLVKDGYETLTVMQSIPAPWYEYTPIDFVAENFVPGQIRDPAGLGFPTAAPGGGSDRTVARAGRGAPPGGSHRHRHRAATVARGRSRPDRPRSRDLAARRPRANSRARGRRRPARPSASLSSRNKVNWPMVVGRISIHPILGGLKSALRGNVQVIPLRPQSSIPEVMP